MRGYVLAIDQGTTSSRAIVFDDKAQIVAIDQEEFVQHFPNSGWVEHEPEDIWNTTVRTCRGALSKACVDASALTSIGITNQRETTVVWDRESGRPVHRAIVWQDRRTAERCAQLKADGQEESVTSKTGLLFDPYFSATKLAWILNNVDGVKRAAEVGRLCFGTIDSYLLWRLTGGAVHATDATNASRTMLYNIHRGDWDQDLIKLFDVPLSMLPEVKNSSDDYGVTQADILGAAVPICGVAGDQQAATVGQACFEPGMMKSTYGTGCFALLNTGSQAVISRNKLLTTIAYQLNGQPTYALEGAIFVAGAAVQWLRDGLGIITSAGETEGLAERADRAQSVYLVPAFVGLGAPHWDAEARGAIFGLTRSTGPAEFARAALESVCYQTRDLLEAMQGDWQTTSERQTVLRVDGGMVASDWAMQFLSDILDAPVDRPQVLETTALGAAYLAGLRTGIYPGQSEFSQLWSLDQRFRPEMDAATRAHKFSGWRDAVRRTLSN